MARAVWTIGAVGLAIAALSLHTPAAAVQIETAEQTRRLTAFGLLPLERHGEVIRYSHSAMEFAGGRATGTRHVVIEVVPDREGRSARLLAVSGRGPLNGAPRASSRAEETISGEEYRSLRMRLVQMASGLTMREQEVSAAFTVCSHAPWARFDLKLGGDSQMLLSRGGGCDQDATAYRAGEFLLVAAERILGRRIDVPRPPVR